MAVPAAMSSAGAAWKCAVLPTVLHCPAAALICTELNRCSTTAMICASCCSTQGLHKAHSPMVVGPQQPKLTPPFPHPQPRASHDGATRCWSLPTTQTLSLPTVSCASVLLGLLLWASLQYACGASLVLAAWGLQALAEVWLVQLGLWLAGGMRLQVRSVERLVQLGLWLAGETVHLGLVLCLALWEVGAHEGGFAEDLGVLYAGLLPCAQRQQTVPPQLPVEAVEHAGSLL
eukprot:6492242-Amphidinium_carterae.1